MLNIINSATERAKGFSLIEVLLALLILSIGLLGLAGMQVSGLRSVRNSTDYTTAALALDDLAERMRANPVSLDLGDYTAYNFGAVNCGVLPAPYCNTPAVSCTPSELAIFEMFTWYCGDANAASLPGNLPNAQANITCDDSDTTDADPCTPGSSHIISLTWTALNQRQDINANDTTQTWTLSMRVLP